MHYRSNYFYVWKRYDGIWVKESGRVHQDTADELIEIFMRERNGRDICIGKFCEGVDPNKERL